MRQLSGGKRVLVGGSLLAAALGFSSTAVSAAPPDHAAQNHETYWENLGYGECEKFEDPADPFVLGNPDPGTAWTLLVIKAGSGDDARDLYPNPAPGSYSFDGTHGASPPSSGAGPVPPCSGASCSGYHAGSPARGNAAVRPSRCRIPRQASPASLPPDARGSR